MMDEELGGNSPAGDDAHKGKQELASRLTGDNQGAPIPPPEELGRDKPASEATEAEIKREKRRRLRMLRGIFESLGIEDQDALALTRDLNDLLPPEHRMSTGRDLAERLEKVLAADNKAPPGLLFTISGVTPLDITDAERAFRSNSMLETLLDNEEGLFRALILNERVHAGLSRQLAEHDAAKRMLLAELVRRYTLAEHWRYLLPKYVLPVFAVLHAAKIRRDDLRAGDTLLDPIIDAVCAYKGDAVNREALVAAAQKTEEQFERILADATDADTDAVPQPQRESKPECEPFTTASSRRQRAFRIAWGHLEPSPREAAELAKLTPEAAEERKAMLRTLTDWEAGLDMHGRPVFASLDHFVEQTEVFREHYAADGA